MALRWPSRNRIRYIERPDEHAAAHALALVDQLVVLEAAEQPHRASGDRARSDQVEQGTHADHTIDSTSGQERQRGSSTDRCCKRPQAPYRELPGFARPSGS